MYNQKLTIESILFSEEPIVINRNLAKYLGVTEAIVFQQIHYWIKVNEKSNNNFHDGRYWTFNTLENWTKKYFEFLSLSTVRRTLKKLTSDGLLLTGNYNKLKGDRTIWYTIDYDRLIEYCEKKLDKKAELSKKRSEAGKKGVESKKVFESYLSKNEEPSDHFEQMVENADKNSFVHFEQKVEKPENADKNSCVQNEQNIVFKLNKPLPDTTLPENTLVSVSVGSNSKGEPPTLVDLFEKNICKLRKTTKPKFMLLTKSYDCDFIKAVIDYAKDCKAYSYDWFEKSINGFVEKNVFTAEGVAEEIIKYAEEGRQAKNRALKEKDAKKQKKSSGFDLPPADEFFEEAVIDLTESENLDCFLEDIKNKFGEENNAYYNSFFSICSAKKKGNIVYLLCPNAFTRATIEKKFYDMLAQLVVEKDYGKRVDIKVDSSVIL